MDEDEGEEGDDKDKDDEEDDEGDEEGLDPSALEAAQSPNLSRTGAADSRVIGKRK